MVRDPFPEATRRLIHARDIADVATAALLGDGHVGRADTLEGPAAISHREQVRAIALAIGREVRFEVVIPARALEDYLRQGGFAAVNAGFLLGFESYSQPGAPTAPQPVRSEAFSTAEAITGRAARTFAEWAREHIAEFTGRCVRGRG